MGGSVIINNMHWQTDVHELAAHMPKYSSRKSVEIIDLDPRYPISLRRMASTAKELGIEVGLVEYGDAADADRAVADMDGTKLNGKTIKVSRTS